MRCTVDAAIEQAALYVIISAYADATDKWASADSDAAHAVSDGGETTALAHNTCGASSTTTVASDDKVLDDGAINMAKRCGPCFVVVARVIYV